MEQKGRWTGVSVIVKGMKMPTRCIYCPFMVSRDNDDCIVQSEEANEKADTCFEKCGDKI